MLRLRSGHSIFHTWHQSLFNLRYHKVPKSQPCCLLTNPLGNRDSHWVIFATSQAVTEKLLPSKEFQPSLNWEVSVSSQVSPGAYFSPGEVLANIPAYLYFLCMCVCVNICVCMCVLGCCGCLGVLQQVSAGGKKVEISLSEQKIKLS